MKKAGRWWHHLTGGRPMWLVLHNYYRICKTNEQVHIYCDGFGRDWMARSPWDLFRLPRPPKGERFPKNQLLSLRGKIVKLLGGE